MDISSDGKRLLVAAGIPKPDVYICDLEKLEKFKNLDKYFFN